MLIGIDVGGTFTDGVLISHGRIVKTAKVPTTRDLLPSLVAVLDEVAGSVPPDDIERVVLSTTLITNLIAEGKLERAAVIMIPGPGVNPADYSVPGKVYVAKGAVDYRGRETEPLDEGEILRIIGAIEREGYRKVAVIGKFSPRNHRQEDQVAALIRKAHPDWEIELGYSAAGQLNFPRRIVNTVMALSTRNAYRAFVRQVKSAFAARGIKGPVLILKADGGTMPIEQAVNQPVETIFSGPAASTMGVLALTPPGQTSVVVDIGGTTTDLALILSGNPLLSGKGARIKEWLTQVRAFAVKSVALGGDSQIRWDADRLQIGPHRAGPAGCLGGDAPTPTDALRVLGLTDVGDLDMARTVLSRLAEGRAASVEEMAEAIVNQVVDRITAEIAQMFLEWETEPAYRIWELKQKGKIRPQNVVGVGGSAPGIIPLVAERLNCHGIIPEHAMVANAIGAAVSRPTLSISLHADTERQCYSVAETGSLGKLPKADRFSLEDANGLARQLLKEQANLLGAAGYTGEMETIHSEAFHMVRDWHTVGRLLDVTVQISPGLIAEWEMGGACHE